MADRDLLNACRAAVRGEPFLYPGAMSKLGMRDRLELTRYAIRVGLIEP